MQRAARRRRLRAQRAALARAVLRRRGDAADRRQRRARAGRRHAAVVRRRRRTRLWRTAQRAGPAARLVADAVSRRTPHDDTLAQRPPGHAGRRPSPGAGSSAARCWSQAAQLHWVGARRRPAGRPAARRRARPGRRAGHAGPGRLPHPPRLRRPARAPSSSCACRAPATRRSPAPAAASAPPWRPRAPPATTQLFASAPRARADADGRGRDHARDQVRLRPERRTRGALPARRAAARPRAAADGAHHLPVGATRCRRSSTAAPTTTSPPSAPGCRRCTPQGLVDAVDAFCERIAFTPAQTRRVFDAARAWACRSSCMPSS